MLYISLITVYKEKALRMEIGVSGYLSGLCPSFATPKRTQCSENWICFIQNTEIFTSRQDIKSFGSGTCVLDSVRALLLAWLTSFTLKMYAVCSSDTCVISYRTTRLHISENSTFLPPHFVVLYNWVKCLIN
jgi:hypothetical protein